MGKSEKRKFGDLGEAIAARYLQDRGFEVIERNFWKPWGEIDIVASKEGILYFFEIKTGNDIGGSRETLRPELNLHAEKLKKFDRVVQTYLWERRIDPAAEWSFQAICILLDMEAKTAKVEVIKDLIS